MPEAAVPPMPLPRRALLALAATLTAPVARASGTGAEAALADEPVPGTPGFGSVPELPRCAGTGCTAPTAQANFLSVSGDVSLDYALDAMLRASPEAAPHASTILQRLRKS